MKKTFCIGISATNTPKGLHELKILSQQYNTEREAEKEIEKTIINKSFQGNIFYILPCFDSKNNGLINVS